MEAIKRADGTWDVTGLPPWLETFDTMLEFLERKVPFKFARYGDGEINCINGKPGHNCDHHNYYSDLGLALHNATQRARYMVGIQPLSISQRLNLDIFHGLDLYNADVLHNASIRKRLPDFVQAMKHRFVVLVGPRHLKKLPFYHLHIEIPTLNCWLKYEEICGEIETLVTQNVIRHESIVFILCASMMSEVIIDRFRDSACTFIDAGSVFDPYAGVKSRRYHYALTI